MDIDLTCDEKGTYGPPMFMSGDGIGTTMRSDMQKCYASPDVIEALECLDLERWLPLLIRLSGHVTSVTVTTELYERYGNSLAPGVRDE